MQNKIIMGCHTWFSVPVVTDKKKILELAQEWLSNDKHISESSKQMYQYAIDNELITPCLELACNTYNENNIEYNDLSIVFDNKWILFKDVKDNSLCEYNKKNGTNYTSVYDDNVYNKIELECYSNEPRIGGYPDKIIESYQDMVDFMKTGFTDEDGKKYDFYYEEDRYNIFMNGIKLFFERHPKGVITFG